MKNKLLIAAFFFAVSCKLRTANPAPDGRFEGTWQVVKMNLDTTNKDLDFSAIMLAALIYDDTTIFPARLSLMPHHISMIAKDGEAIGDCEYNILNATDSTRHLRLLENGKPVDAMLKLNGEEMVMNVGGVEYFCER